MNDQPTTRPFPLTDESKAYQQMLGMIQPDQSDIDEKGIIKFIDNNDNTYFVKNLHKFNMQAIKMDSKGKYHELKIFKFDDGYWSQHYLDVMTAYMKYQEREQNKGRDYSEKLATIGTCKVEARIPSHYKELLKQDNVSISKLINSLIKDYLFKNNRI